MYDELRIWKTARTADEIKADYKLRYADALLPNDLVAYYPGDVVTINGTKLLCDHTGRAHHGSFPNDNLKQKDMDTLTNAITPDLQEKIDNYFESI